ncbi:MAG: penicillin-binding protein 2 [Patescibacteria group bacterium]|nr:penicillin-binding protein 2 [Patescibacteria group bacterium]
MKLVRVRFLLISLGLALLLIWLKLFQIQVLDHSRYESLAEAEHWKSLSIPAQRGKIISADGYTIVDNKVSYLLYAHPREIASPKETAKEITPILFNENDYTDSEKKLGLDNLKKDLEERLGAELSQNQLYWVSLFHKLSLNQKEAIEKLKISGLGFEEEPERYYPEGSLAAFILGFVGSDNLGQDKGYYGLEGYYNGDLKGEPGQVIEEQTATGNPILLGGYEQIPSRNGRDLVLTINRSVQYIVEKELKAGVAKYGAKSGTVVVEDPLSGALVAMASYPSFDPASWLRVARQASELSQESTASEVSGAASNVLLSFRNPAIADTYEPGSVMKGLTMSAGIDLGSVTPQTTFDDSGPIFVGGYKVDNWDKKHWGIQNMIEVLQKSNNMGASFVARTIGAGSLREYFLKFGLGSLTGVDLEGEDSGIVKSLSDFHEIDLVTNSFGQGISVTPLQLTAAYSAIANGGILYKPYVVSEIKDSGKVIKFGKTPVRQVISLQKSKVMTEMLTAAAEGGEGKFFILKNYHIAGKTGTAQIPVPGGYDPNKSNATFIGFLPSSLKFVMLVKLSQPSTSIYSAETAVPLWMDIVKDLATYYGIPPDR